MTSIIIPACDEARVIGHCLRALLNAQGPAVARPRTIHVIANGCTDDTAGRAREFSRAGVQVHETSTASKIAALRLGDEAAAGAFPRISVDADVLLAPGALTALETALDQPGTLAAAPRLRVALDGRPLPVRWFYRDFLTSAWVREGLLGSGCYALSAGGRARFGDWPEVMNDDGFIHHLFGPGERVTVSSWFQIQAPRTVPALVAAKARVAIGNAELARLRADGTLPPSRHEVRPGGLRRDARRCLTEPHIMLNRFVLRRRIAAAARRRLRHGEERLWAQDPTTR